MQYGATLDSFYSSFTFVTDRAENMGTILWASVFPSAVSFFNRLSGCISHEINTVIKHSVESKYTQIHHNLKCARRFVTFLSRKVSSMTF